MREINIYRSDDGFAGCCAIGILYDFPGYESYDYEIDAEPLLKGALTDEEWFYLLEHSVTNDYPLYTFANSSGANTGPCTPTKLARWLRSKGEKVSTGASAVNPSSKNTITIYTWAPSKAYYKKLEAYKNKKNKKNAANASRGALAA